MKKFILILLLTTGCLFSASISLNAFNSGEISPLLRGRVDVKRYYSGVEIMENMVVLAQGGATKRPGSYYIANAKDSDYACRLIPFEFSVTQAYIIEIGDKYFRFYKDGGQIKSGNDPYEIETPYDYTDIFEIQFIQSADTMYLVHSEYKPRKLTRTGHTSWTLTIVDFERGPFLAENETDITITPSATTGSITLTASSDVWNSNHVGALWQITHTVEGAEVTGSFTAVGNSSTTAVQKGREFDFTSHGNWTGTIVLQRSYDDGSTWKDVIPFHNVDDGNISYSDDEVVDDALYRVRMNAYTSGTCKYNLVVRSFDVDGVVEITEYISATEVSATVDYTLGGTTATKYWSEGAFSDDEGYPNSVAFYEERICYAATVNQPQRMWFSQTDDWNNFLIGSDATDSLDLTIVSDQVNAIRWMIPQSKLLIGTSGGEWTLSAQTPEEPLTPTNISARRQSVYGSADIQGIATGHQAIFVQRQGRKVRQMQYSFELDNWISPDLTLISEHITNDGIIDMALMKNPYPILWLVRDDGILIGVTLEETQEVIGWHRHIFNGSVESIAIIPGDDEDEIWISIERFIDGNIIRYIEQLQSFNWGDEQFDMFFVDSGLTYDGGAEVNITNITKANPCIVSAAAHGFSNGDQVLIEDVVGMIEVNQNVYTVDDATTNSFSLDDSEGIGDINSTEFTTYISNGTVKVVEDTFSNINHLEKETVGIIADGGYYGTEIVTGSTVRLDDFYNTVHIGLPYISKIKTASLEFPTSPGTLFGETKRLTKVILRFDNTLSCDIGTSWDDYNSCIFRDADDLLETSTPLYSGIKIIDFEGDYEEDTNLYIQSRLPLPLTILSFKTVFEKEN